MAENLKPAEQPQQVAPNPATNQPNTTAQEPKQTQPQVKRRVLIPKRGPAPIKTGELFVGRYMYWKHDPTPLVLFSKQYKDGRLAGINLHRLTLNDMRSLIAQYCNKAFSYALIKGRKEIAQAFRTYKQDGFGVVQVINCEYMLKSLGIIKQARNMSPNEVEKMRIQIQQQVRQQINPKAEDLMGSKSSVKPSGTMPGKSASVPGIQVGGQQTGNS